MKIKKSELKQIIQEEIETVLTEKGKIKPQTPEHKAAIKKVDPEMPIDEPPRAEKAWLNRGVIDYDDDGTVKGRGGWNESQDQLYQMVQEELEAVLGEAGGTWDPVQAKEKTEKAQRAAALAEPVSPAERARLSLSAAAANFVSPAERARLSLPAPAKRPDTAAPAVASATKSKDTAEEEETNESQDQLYQMVQETLQAVIAERNR